MLNSFLRDNELWTSDLPGDINIVAVTGEERGLCDSFIFLVESKEFREVGESQLIPFVEATFKRSKVGG